MRFSYHVKTETLLQDISLPLTAGKVSLITGVENGNLGILAGVIAKLIPVTASVAIPQIAALIENYTGELSVTEGELPRSVAYVGVDPDRHLLFSTVEEELLAQLGKVNFEKCLATVGLTTDFLSRQIATLSGGEKMRIALALAFATNSDVYVLHGCIPWLDKMGREMLLTQIMQAKNKHASVIVIEHEVAALANIVDEVLVFDGTTLQPAERQQFFAHTFNRNEFGGLSVSQSNANILEFKHVDFSYAANPLLVDISLVLKAGGNYLLLGENGAGKSTIAQMIFRVLKPQAGEILLKGKALGDYSRIALNKVISYVGQFPLQQITLSTVDEYKQRMQNPLALKLFANYLNLPDDFPVSVLSFLQLKILCLISALSPTTELIILDEPTWGIDNDGRLVLWRLLQEIAQFLQFSLLIITHDVQLKREFQADILWLQEGKINVQ